MSSKPEELLAISSLKHGEKAQITTADSYVELTEDDWVDVTVVILDNFQLFFIDLTNEELYTDHEVRFVRHKPEPEFEVGKWYKDKDIAYSDVFYECIKVTKKGHAVFFRDTLGNDPFVEIVQKEDRKYYNEGGV